MDFITDLPATQDGSRSVLVTVDRFSKMCHISKLSNDTSAGEVAKVFFQDIVRLHGLPSSIVSDRDARFTSNFWQQLFKLLGCQLLMSSAHHPETDGQTERTIRTIEQVLRAYTYDKQKQWDQYLSLIEMCCNAYPSSTTKQSPYYVVYGRELQFPVDLIIQTSVPAVEHSLQGMQQIWDKVKVAIERAQGVQKEYADRARRPEEFAVGDLVLLSTANLSLSSQLSKKQKQRFTGPFKVAKRIGQQAYKLEVPGSFKAHPVFHVSLLRRYSGPQLAPPDPVEVDGEKEWVVSSIKAHRKSRNGSWEYLVSFEGYDTSYDEWLPVSNLRNARQLLRSYLRTYPH